MNSKLKDEVSQDQYECVALTNTGNNMSSEQLEEKVYYLEYVFM